MEPGLVSTAAAGAAGVSGIDDGGASAACTFPILSDIKIVDLEIQSDLMPSEGLTPKPKSPDSDQKIKNDSLRKRITPSSNQIKRSLKSQISTKTANHKKISLGKENKSSSRSITFSGHELERTFSGLDQEQITEFHWDFKPLC